VGLRPGRSSGCRLSSEKITVGNRELILAHCYGHGGAGVTLSMGCAEELVVDHILPYLRA
jgi:D-amino-acid oxidase